MSTRELVPPAWGRTLSPRATAATAVVCLALALGIGLTAVGIAPLLTLAVAGGLVAAAGAAASIEIAVALLVVTVAVFNRSELFVAAIPFFGGGLRPTDMLLATALGGALVRALLRRVHRQRDPFAPNARLPATALVATAFVVWAVLSSILSIADGVNYKESLVELRPLLHYALIVPLVAELTPDGVRRITRLLVIAAAAAGVKALALFIGGDTGNVALFTGGVARVTDVEFMYLISGIVLALLYRAERVWSRLVLVPVAVLCLGGLAVTFFRAAWLALGVALAFVFWKGNRAGRRAVLRFATIGTLALPLLTVVMAVHTGQSVSLVVSLAQRLASIGDYREDVSAQHRLSEWQAALARIGEQPLVGNGLGSRVGFYSPMYDHVKIKVGFWSNDIYIHNGYLWLATKLGLVGLTLFLALLVTSLRTAVSTLGRGPPAEARALLLGFAAIFVALGVSSVFGAMFSGDTLTPFIAFAVAAVHVLAREPGDATPSVKAMTPKPEPAVPGGNLG